MSTKSVECGVRSESLQHGINRSARNLYCRSGLIPAKMFVLPHVFTEELSILDAPTADADVVWEKDGSIRSHSLKAYFEQAEQTPTIFSISDKKKGP